MSEFKRADGRANDEIRPIKAEIHVLKNADGSAYFEMGNTKVIAAVYGPREYHPKQLALPQESMVRVRYHMIPFSVKERKSPTLSRREIEISKVIKEAFSGCIKKELFPKSTIDVYIEVLNADGSTRVASINAVSLALVDAGIFMFDLVSAVSVGKIGNQLIVDLTGEEDQNSEADMPIAMMPSLNKIVLLQMDGFLTMDEFNKLLTMGVEAIKKIYEKQKEVIRGSLEYLLKMYGQS
ncbi:MAG: exosome complex exonuclease Rrp41 [Thermoproteota archaeon]|jgi:ribosomal RNA-processing protein RRP41/SKI6 (EC 3.1.13.-)